jgi:hypothetical protein
MHATMKRAGDRPAPTPHSLKPTLGSNLSSFSYLSSSLVATFATASRATASMAAFHPAAAFVADEQGGASFTASVTTAATVATVTTPLTASPRRAAAAPSASLPELLKLELPFEQAQVTVFVSLASLRARFGAPEGGLDRLDLAVGLHELYQDHRAEIDAAAIRKLLAGARQPLVLRAGDLEDQGG